MFAIKAFEVLKIKVPIAIGITFVNDCFKGEHNEEIGHFGQILINSEAQETKFWNKAPG